MGGLVDWGAGANMDPEGPRGVFKSAIEGAEKGYELGQKRAQVHALQGIDLNDANSVDAGIGNLVRANAAEQANALQNLAVTRSVVKQIPDLMGKLTGTAQPQSAPQDQAPDPQHVAETLSMGKQAADQLLGTPAAERPAAFAQIKQTLMQRGVPEAAIDSAGADLSDQGLQSLSAHYGELLAHTQHQISPQEGAQAPAMPGAHASNSWYDKVAEDPQTAMAVSLMKRAGLDFSPMLEQARALAMPGIQKRAELEYAPQIAAQLAGVDVAKEGALNPVRAAGAAQSEAAKLPYAIAKAKADADIAAGHDFISVPEVGPDGQPTGKVNTYRKDVAIAQGGNGPVGSTRAPEDQAAKNADTGLFAERYKADSDPSAMRADINARDTAIAAAHMAQNINPSNLTPWLAKNANTLNGLGVKIAAKDANNLATYQNLVAQNLKSAIQVFPQNQAEFHAIENAVASSKTPGDAAALALTQVAAVRDAQAAQRAFRVQWAQDNPNSHSERAFQTAWRQQPIASQSVFASPLFRDLKINGQPAVAIAPPFESGPYKGQVYGIFMPGTPQKSRFRVR